MCTIQSIDVAQSELNDTLSSHGVLGFDEGPDQVSEQVLLYRLNDLPDIIASLSSHPDQELVDAVKEEIRKFNPKDEYWSLRLR